MSFLNKMYNEFPINKRAVYPSSMKNVIQDKIDGEICHTQVS